MASVANPTGISRPIKTEYKSELIDIPTDFLQGPPPTAISINLIDFAAQGLPEYKNCVAFTLDNVVSRDECNQLIALAESAVPLSKDINIAQRPAGKHPAWQPAMVNMGVGFEVRVAGYRESDRIIWDRQEVMDLLWKRMKHAEGLEERLRKIAGSPRDFGRKKGLVREWKFSRLNERMRFLRYGPGQYFKPHCDGPYEYRDANAEYQTFYTVHLYLNDAGKPSGGGKEPLIGGATTFLSRDETRSIDVNPKAGSVLVFQHKMLYHEGAEVIRGVKYTMRADILYELVQDGR